VGGALLFWAPGGVPVLLPAMSLTLVGTMGSFPVIQTYASELFPTSLRGAASSWGASAGVFGRTASLGIAAVVLALTDENQSITATVLGAGPLVAVLMIAALFPDTHGRELEDTSGEAPLPGAEGPVPPIPAGPGAPPDDDGAGIIGALP
jgi:MFS family permease